MCSNGRPTKKQNRQTNTAREIKHTEQHLKTDNNHLSFGSWTFSIRIQGYNWSVLEQDIGLIVWLIKSKKVHEKFQKLKGEVFKCLVLFRQKHKTQSIKLKLYKTVKSEEMQTLTLEKCLAVFFNIQLNIIAQHQNHCCNYWRNLKCVMSAGEIQIRGQQIIHFKCNIHHLKCDSSLTV